MAAGQHGRVLITSLTNVGQEVFAAGFKALVETVIVAGGAADRVVVFQAASGTPEWFRLAVKAGDSQTITRDSLFFVPAQGMRVITTAAAGDVTVTVVYLELL